MNHLGNRSAGVLGRGSEEDTISIFLSGKPKFFHLFVIQGQFAAVGSPFFDIPGLFHPIAIAIFVCIAAC